MACIRSEKESGVSRVAVATKVFEKVSFPGNVHAEGSDGRKSHLHDIVIHVSGLDLFI